MRNAKKLFFMFTIAVACFLALEATAEAKAKDTDIEFLSHLRNKILELKESENRLAVVRSGNSELLTIELEARKIELESNFLILMFVADERNWLQTDLSSKDLESRQKFIGAYKRIDYVALMSTIESYLKPSEKTRLLKIIKQIKSKRSLEMIGYTEK